MSNLFAIVGEHQDEPDRYLVIGEDGHYYDWDLSTEETRPVEPSDEWEIDDAVPSGRVRFEDMFLGP